MRLTPNATHLNDVEPLSASMAAEYLLFETRDLVVSVRHLNLVFVFDPDSLTVKWHSSGSVVWEWIHQPRDGKVPSVKKGQRYSLTPERVASWPCSSVDSLRTSGRTVL